jgi:predicted metal-dependent peptidase
MAAPQREAAVNAASDAQLARKLHEARFRVLREQPFFGLLLLHMNYGLDEDCETACTDGRSIRFGPAFLKRLTPWETDFVLLHEIAHVALGHCFRHNDRDSERFNIACDLVVNSLLLTELPMFQSCTRLDGAAIAHLTPKGDEAVLHSAEEVYEMLLGRRGVKKRKGQGNGDGDGDGGSGKGKGSGLLDDHGPWRGLSSQERKSLRDEWGPRLLQTALTVEIQHNSTQCGHMPLLASRMLGALRRPQTDWRTLLHNFIQQEVCDYGFAPPDRRFQDAPFILPDWSETRETPGKLWFMVDASSSISDEAMTSAFTEIVGALDTFGNLDAVLSFFDHAVTDPVPFATVHELLALRPRGGGGTSFHNVFACLKTHMATVQPDSLIIMTDGYANFPPESAALRLPVLWLVNNEEVTPPWGKIARWKP